MERVLEALCKHMREERIEQPARLRLGRVIGSALRQSEATLTTQIASRLPDAVTARMWLLIAAASDDPDDQEQDPTPPATADAGTDDDTGPRGPGDELGRKYGHRSSPTRATSACYINTLMIQDTLAQPEWADALGDDDRRGLTPRLPAGTPWSRRTGP